MSDTIITERLADLEHINLDKGGHSNFEQGHCAMEVVAWLAGLGHTDAPSCASPVLRAYTIRLNDRWDDEQRQALKPYLPRMVGTAGDGQDETRLKVARDALLTDLLPAWLTLAGLTDDAATVTSWASEDLEKYELRTRLWDLRDRIWRARGDRFQALRARVRQAVKDKLADADAAAAAAAAAAADADAAAAAAAVADAVAAAVAAADADAAAAAVAAAAAAADAAAAAAAAAAAVADAPWGATYDKAYKAARKAYADAIAVSTDPAMVAVRELSQRQQGVALAILDRMIDPSKAA